MKELGAHILVCEVTYSAPQREKMNFRKFFKFQVMKPLDVKTKFYNAEVKKRVYRAYHYEWHTEHTTMNGSATVLPPYFFF